MTVPLSMNTIVLGVLGFVAFWLGTQFMDLPKRTADLEAAFKGVGERLEEQEEGRKAAEQRLQSIENSLARIPDQIAGVATNQARSDLAMRDIQQAVVQLTTAQTAAQAQLPDMARRIDRLSQLMSEFRQALMKSNGTGQAPSFEEELPPLAKPQHFKPAAMWCPCATAIEQRWW